MKVCVHACMQAYKHSHDQDVPSRFMECTHQSNYIYILPHDHSVASLVSVCCMYITGAMQRRQKSKVKKDTCEADYCPYLLNSALGLFPSCVEVLCTN